MFNPIEFGENLKIDLALSYIQSRGLAIKNFIDNLVPENPNNVAFSKKLDEFIKVKGPYIQALDLPLFSKEKFESYARNLSFKYANSGLWDELIKTMNSIGIDRLYDFQETFINKILSKLDNYLITAPTGRGKTEAWLIPLLNFILNIKKGKSQIYYDNSKGRTKTKIVLLYPTKALAQDQFKRLINYLYILNKFLSEEEKITIGIYDGDTPHKNKYDAREILQSTYGLYECPLYNPLNKKTCSDICKNLIVKYDIPLNETSRRPHLVLSKEACESRVDFSFIYLTRDDIENNGVDILITNPDELNIQLINFNTFNTRDVFILDPIFYVLDEIHIYSGIFGSYLSMILKRLKVCRKSLLEDDLANYFVIGASATIANRRELFSKIIGRNESEFDVIIANSIDLTIDKINSLSDNDKKILKLIDKQIEIIDIENLIKIQNCYDNFKISEIQLQSIENIQNFLYNYFLNLNNNNVLSVLMRHFHSITNHKPLTRQEIIEQISNFIESSYNFDINKLNLNNIFQNLYSLGTFSGILENRSHLFIWPIDGFYGCINCGKIYQTLRATCDECGEDFITKVLYCSRCSDLYYESWYCPECQNLFPVQVNNEGLFNRFENFYCPYEHEQKIECARIIWKPQFICQKCKASYHKRNLPNCPKCSNIESDIPLELMINKSVKYFYCRQCKNDFDYNKIIQRENICYNDNCSNDLINLKMRNIINEKKCDCEIQQSDIGHINKCVICGEKLEQKKIIPWFCKSCGKKYFSKQPPQGSCTSDNCNSRSFYLDAYFEPSVIYQNLNVPSQKYLKLNEKIDKIDNTKYQMISPSLKNYCLIDHNYRIRNNIDPISKKFLFDGKCEIRGSRINKRIGNRFLDILYTPNYTSTRISQFLLRQFFLRDKAINQNESLRKAKILSFSDSVRDMDLLAENFFESEIVLYIDQLIFNALDQAINKEVPLIDLQQTLISNLEQYIDNITEKNPTLIRELKGKIRKALKSTYPNVYNYFIINNKNLDELLREIIRRIVMNKDNVRHFVLEGINDFDIEFKEGDLSEHEKDRIFDIKNHYKYPPTFKSFSYASTFKIESEIEDLKHNLEITNQDARSQINNLKDEIEKKQKEKEKLLNAIQSDLEGLVKKKYLIKEVKRNHEIYYINPNKIRINLVSNENPIFYNRFKGEFITKFEYRFLRDEEKKELELFNLNTESRIDFTKPAFSRVAFLMVKFYPCLLNSEAYKGETSPTKRRRLEYYFKNGMFLNYISSGPAMEVGIDIGDLNIMLLYGTPPNINSYLQRIGRAGRKLKKSLIVSLSKRNPIDYYYYQKPYDLMTQNVQAVPINDKNSRVIRNSLVWSILDYINNNYIIEWDDQRREDNI